MNPEQLSRKWQEVQQAVQCACRRVGRPAESVEIMAVTKYASDEQVLSLLQNGQVRHIGESRVQQAVKRWMSPAFAKYHIVKHFIGHLQSNKAAQAAALFDFIDSLDSLHTAQALSTQAQKLGKKLGVLLQIKLTDRTTQSGLSLQQAPQLLQALQQLPGLQPCGYMAIAPQNADQRQLRGLFARVRQAFERDFPPSLPQRYLSLGMSGDFETAVEEGSTLPRIGSGLFAAPSEEI